jgi:RNA polymerase sigma-70 factor (ECF subfamily)
MGKALTDTPASFQAAADPCVALHSRFRRPLCRFFATYRLNAADVEDFTQEVFLRLVGASRQEELRAPEAFVFTLARNLVRDRARRLQTRGVTVAMQSESDDLPCARPQPDQALETLDRLRQVVTALERLKPETSEAFYLNRIDGHSYTETAEQMGVSVSMVEKHIMAALAALRGLD